MTKNDNSRSEAADDAIEPGTGMSRGAWDRSRKGATTDAATEFIRPEIDWAWGLSAYQWAILVLFGGIQFSSLLRQEFSDCNTFGDLKRRLLTVFWRKCMGIEPTDHMISMQPYGFEDRGRHQPNKHFQANLF